MKRAELIDNICEYARTCLASKAKSKIVQFMIGAGTVGTGRRIIEEKMSAFMPMFEGEDGEVDICALHECIMGGFEASENLPLLGGMFSLDGEDAKGLHDFLKSKQGEHQSTQQTA